MKNLLLALYLLNFNNFYAQQITCSEWQKLIPGSALPAEVKCQKANNNLDLINYMGRYFFSFRTAPTHFASEKTKLYILSSADLQNWHFEKVFYDEH